MLSFEKRLALLEAELAETTPEKLFEELMSYDAKGPLAYSYLEEVIYTTSAKSKTLRVIPQKITSVYISNEKTKSEYNMCSQNLSMAA